MADINVNNVSDAIPLSDEILTALRNLKEEEVIPSIPMPVDIYLHEAEMLLQWCYEDKAELVKGGLDWTYVETLKERINALRTTESAWNKERFAKKEAAELWKLKGPELFDLRHLFLHFFRYAYRAFPGILSRVDAIAASDSYPGIIQDVNDLSVLGKANIPPLEKVSFDLSLLDKGPSLAAEAASLFANVSITSNTSAAKKLRDRAFTYLKMTVDEICAAGQFVFWKNEERRRGYSSTYLRRIRKRREKAVDGNSSGTVENKSETK